MSNYWFWEWTRRHRVTDGHALRRALSQPKAVDKLQKLLPTKIVFKRPEPPDISELTAGKGIDSTGKLGCRHINCLSKEVDGLFRHTWHYFDQISLPDQALESVLCFQHNEDIERLCEDLEPFILILEHLNGIGGLDLIRFDGRKPPCPEHFKKHAEEAQINQAFVNTSALVKTLVETAKITCRKNNSCGHFHINYQLISKMFEHYEWGTLCSQAVDIPASQKALKESVALAVVHKYLAALSADALAARYSKSPLGSTIPFYKRLLATYPSPTVESVAFELALPVTHDAPVKALIKLRRNEADSFSRFQRAIRIAIGERLRTVGSRTAESLATEIKKDVIDPELQTIREKLRKSRIFALRGAATGLGLGTVAATVGLLAPLGAVGTGLVIGGAITLGAQALKKANDDELAALSKIQMSDLYFLWRGHQHGHGSGKPT